MLIVSAKMKHNFGVAILVSHFLDISVVGKYGFERCQLTTLTIC